MTEGHKHRTVRLKRSSLRYRLLKITLHTTDYETATRSRLVYGAETLDSEVWTLTVLGLLHGLMGLTVEVLDE